MTMEIDDSNDGNRRTTNLSSATRHDCQQHQHQQQQERESNHDQHDFNSIDVNVTGRSMANKMTDAEASEQLPEFASLDASIVAAEAAAQSQHQRHAQGYTYTRIAVPPHRYTPLKEHWPELYTPIVEHMKLQIRFNTSKRCIELRQSTNTQSSSPSATVIPNAIQKSCDFLHAFLLGFEIRDCIALLRLDDLYIDSFEIKDVKSLSGEHLSRAIGRIAGQGGKTRYTIENATRTRIVLADTRIHILGSFQAIRTARSAIVRLILGSQPAKVYTQMRAVSQRAKQRF